ncbi:unnamed protein product, partial [Nesidiocoris tenuis]
MKVLGSVVVPFEKGKIVHGLTDLRCRPCSRSQKREGSHTSKRQPPTSIRFMFEASSHPRARFPTGSSRWLLSGEGAYPARQTCYQSLDLTSPESMIYGPYKYPVFIGRTRSTL